MAELSLLSCRHQQVSTVPAARRSLLPVPVPKLSIPLCQPCPTCWGLETGTGKHRERHLNTHTVQAWGCGWAQGNRQSLGLSSVDSFLSRASVFCWDLIWFPIWPTPGAPNRLLVPTLVHCPSWYKTSLLPEPILAGSAPAELSGCSG